jgi:hypothetical protein
MNELDFTKYSDLFNQYLESYPYLYHKDKYGYTKELSPYDFGDDTQLEPDMLSEILDSKNPEEELLDLIDRWYFDGILDEEQYTMDSFNEWLEKQGIPACDDIEVVASNLSIYISPDSFLDTSYGCSISIDTGDGNNDFASNPSRSYIDNLDSYDEFEISDDASLLWLVESQGYNETQLKDALWAESNDGLDKFMRTVREEVYESYDMGDVIFLCRATLRQLIQVAKGNYKAVKVSTQSSCGLYDPGMGGGSLLGIELVKDVIIPKDIIWDFDTTASTIRDIYGLWDEDFYGEIELL